MRKTTANYKRHLAYQPTIKYGIPNAKPWEREYQEFWTEQVKRCVKGYHPPGHEWIPGRYYFYLNFCKISTAYSGGKRKIREHPYYRDMDLEYFKTIEDAREKGKGIIYLKARRKGATMANIGGIAVYEMTIPNGNEIGLGCFSEDQVGAFKSRFEDIYATLPDFFKQKRIISNKDQVKFGDIVKTTDNVEVEVGSKNTMYFKDFYNKTGAFRGHSLTFLLFEEAGENPLLKPSFLVSEECWKEGAYQFGTPIIFGTSNQINNGQKDLEEMWYEADKYNLIPFFVPASKVYFPFFDLKTGVSDVVKAEEDILKRRIQKKSGVDKLAYYTYMQEMPLKVTDCFMIGASGIFNLELIHSQQEFLKDDKRARGMVSRGNLEWERDIDGNPMKTVEWIVDPRGKMYMLYPPIEEEGVDSPDMGGVDPYRKIKSETSDSQGSLHIYRDVTHMDIPDELPVFEYMDRPSSKEEFYDNCAKAAVWYNAKLLVEDTDEEFFSWFKSNGFGSYLKEAPLVYKTVWTKASNQHGYNISGAGKKSHLIDCVNDYVNKHCHNIYFPKLLGEMTVFGIKNTDRVMSFGLALINALDNAHRKVNLIKSKNLKRMDFPGLSMKNGKLTPNYQIKRLQQNDWK